MNQRRTLLLLSGLVCRGTHPGNGQSRASGEAYGVDGTPVWTSTLGGGGGIYGVNREILVEDLNGDNIDDLVLVVDESVQPSNHRVFGIDGSMGWHFGCRNWWKLPRGDWSVERGQGDQHYHATGNKVLYEWDGETGKLLGRQRIQPGITTVVQPLLIWTAMILERLFSSELTRGQWPSMKTVVSVGMWTWALPPARRALLAG